MKKSLAILLSLMIAVTLIFPASATELGDLTPMGLNPIDTEEINVLNELTARSTVTKYFNERLAFLNGETIEFPTAIPTLRDNEGEHREQIAKKGITLLNSVITFESIQCEERYATLVISEELIYSDITGAHVEIISHRIIVSRSTERQLRVSFDAYQITCSEFTSSSYTVKREEAVPTVAGGSAPCIVRVAEAEIGTCETGENYTKYGKWYGFDGQPWCVMFVIWCAYYSNVSETVIPRECEANRFIDLFAASQIKLGGAYGGVERPQPGDIYFRGTGINDLEHVGIIVEVYTDYFVIVDGNNGNKVDTDEVEWDAPNFYAYVRPNYATTNHTTGSWYYDSSEHWHVCESCNFRVDKAYHSLGSWQIDTEEHWKKCTGCNVTFNWGSHSYGGWGYNTTYHWKACTSCGYKVNNATHTATGGWIYDSSQHWKTCSVCGGRTSVASHTYTAGYCSTCRYNPNISIDNIPGMERSPK